jgi:ribosomal protein L16/L10AE
MPETKSIELEMQETAARVEQLQRVLLNLSGGENERTVHSTISPQDIEAVRRAMDHHLARLVRMAKHLVANPGPPWTHGGSI